MEPITFDHSKFPAIDVLRGRSLTVVEDLIAIEMRELIGDATKRFDSYVRIWHCFIIFYSRQLNYWIIECLIIDSRYFIMPSKFFSYLPKIEQFHWLCLAICFKYIAKHYHENISTSELSNENEHIFDKVATE